MRKVLACILTVSSLSPALAATPTHLSPDAEKPGANKAECLQLNQDFLQVRHKLQQENAAPHPPFARGLNNVTTPQQLGIYMLFSDPVGYKRYLDQTSTESKVGILLIRDLLLGCSGTRITIK